MLQLFFDTDPSEDLRHFLRKQVSLVLLKSLQEIYGFHTASREKQLSALDGIIEYYFPENFFKNLGFFYHCKDLQAARAFLYCKLIRLMEKLKDPQTVFGLDLIERRLLSAAVQAAADRKYSRLFEEDLSAEKEVSRILCQAYDISAEKARSTARHILRFSQLSTRDENDFFHVFPSGDHELFFRTSFLGGLEAMKSSVGEDRGYGYEKVCLLFSDAGLPVPILLLGSREASRLQNEINRELLKKGEKNLLNIRRFLLHRQDPPKAQ